VDSNLYGYEGRYPDVTTIGLRNLTRAVSDDGIVTLSATTMTNAVSRETFKTIAGPTYGTVYRGVAYVAEE
jgi:hypothetical protein